MSNARDGGFANGPEKGSTQSPSERLRLILEVGDRLWGDLASASKPFESRLYKLEGELRIAREHLKNAPDSEKRRYLRERIRMLSEHLLSIRRERASARREAIMSALRLGWELGEVEQEWKAGTPERISRIVEAEVSGYLPRDWLLASKEFGPIEGRHFEERSGQYTPASAPERKEVDGGLLELSSRVGEEDARRILLHEMCHRVEEVVPEVVELEREFRERRLASGGGFFDTYCERRYDPNEEPDFGIEAYEILAMGIEHIYEGPRPMVRPVEDVTDISDDPEHEKFVLGVLAVVGRRREGDDD